MSLLDRTSGVVEFSVDDVGRRIQCDSVGRPILNRHYSPCTPVRDSTEDRGEILDYLVSLLPRLEEQVTTESWFVRPVTVRHQLIAVLRDRIQSPLVQAVRIDVLTESVPIVGEEVVETPRRIVRPREFERAVPGSGIAATDRVVVVRHLYDQSTHPVSSGRN